MSILSKALMLALGSGGTVVSPTDPEYNQVFAPFNEDGDYVDDVYSTYLYTGNNSTSLGITTFMRNFVKKGSINPTYWLSTLGGTSTEFLTDFCVDTDGSTYFTGYQTQYTQGGNDIWIGKLNPDGSAAWNYGVGKTGISSTDRGKRIAVSADAVYILSSLNSDTDGAALQKWGKDGTVIWETRISGGGSDGATALAIDNDGNIVLGLYSTSGTLGGNAAVLVKMSPAGAIIWQRKADSSYQEYIYDLKIDSDNNIVAAGQCSTPTSGGFLGMFAMKYTSAGDPVWFSANMITGSTNSCTGVSVDSEKNVYIVGEATIGGLGTEPVVLKLNGGTGTLLWQRALIGVGAVADRFARCAVDPTDDCLIAVGSQASFPTNISGISGLVAKFDKNGNLVWHRILETIANLRPEAISITADGVMYLGGVISNFSIGAQDGFICKLPSDGTLTNHRFLKIVNAANFATYPGNELVDTTRYRDGTFTLNTSPGLVNQSTAHVGSQTPTLALVAINYSRMVAAFSAVNYKAQPVEERRRLLWFKSRSQATDHALYDEVRGNTFDLSTNTSSGQSVQAEGVKFFRDNSFIAGNLAKTNTSGQNYRVTTIREAKKFFNIVKYTGDGEANRQIAHALSIAPGAVIIKRLDAVGDWWMYHRAAMGDLKLYPFTAQSGTRQVIPAVSDTTFTVSANAGVNAIGGQYIAYLFAHDDSPTSVIKCLGFNSGGSGGTEISLGWEPQWVLFGSTNGGGAAGWVSSDAQLPQSVPGYGGTSYADKTNTESPPVYGGSADFYHTANGFYEKNFYSSSSLPCVCIAIRRSIRTPVRKEQVLHSAVATGTGGSYVLNANIAFTGMGGMAWSLGRTVNIMRYCYSKSLYGKAFDFKNNGGGVNGDFTTYNSAGVTVTDANLNTNGATFVHHQFRRWVGFMDIVDYLTNGGNRIVQHALGVVPEMIIVKAQGSVGSWCVYHKGCSAGKGVYLDSISAENVLPILIDQPTANSFRVNSPATLSWYQAQMFATLPGISKVGSYVGNGAASQDIDCGLASSPRLILIKRIDTSSNWALYDTARGISTAADRRLLLNDSSTEVTTDDDIDPLANGFTVNLNATGLNVNGGKYIYLAIA